MGPGHCWNDWYDQTRLFKMQYCVSGKCATCDAVKVAIDCVANGLKHGSASELDGDYTVVGVEFATNSDLLKGRLGCEEHVQAGKRMELRRG